MDGAIKVPRRNQPRTFPRSVCVYMSAMQAGPMTWKAIPKRAESVRKAKKAARFGERAVPIEQPRKRNAAMIPVCHTQSQQDKTWAN